MPNTDTLTLKLNPTVVSGARLTVATDDYGYSIPFVVQDSTATAFDITDYTVTLKVWAPSDPTTYIIDETCTQDTPASGTCHYTTADGDFDTAGTYLGKLLLTKTGESLSTEQFVLVVQTSAASYCTLAEVKDALDITGTSLDDLLSDLIQAATGDIDGYCHRSFALTSATKYYDGCKDRLIVDDLVSVTTLKLDEDGDGTYEETLATTDYLLCPYNETPYWMILLSEQSDYASFAEGVLKGVEIIGTWGYASVPEPVRQAAVIQTCRIYRLSQAGFGTEVGTPEIGTSTVYQGLSSDAKRLLGNYVRVRYA